MHRMTQACLTPVISRFISSETTILDLAASGSTPTPFCDGQRNTWPSWDKWTASQSTLEEPLKGPSLIFHLNDYPVPLFKPTSNESKYSHTDKLNFRLGVVIFSVYFQYAVHHRDWEDSLSYKTDSDDIHKLRYNPQAPTGVRKNPNIFLKNKKNYK